MAMRNFFSGGRFILPEQITESETMENLNIRSPDNDSLFVNHSYVNGSYIIKKNDNTHLINFKSDNSLDNCGLKTHINNSISPLQAGITTHQITLDDHETRLSSVEAPSDIVVVNGTSTNNNFNQVSSVAVSNNTFGVIEGFIYSIDCFIKFKVHLKNISNVLTINYNDIESNNINDENISFSVSGSNVNINFKNKTGTNKYVLKYSKNIISI